MSKMATASTMVLFVTIVLLLANTLHAMETLPGPKPANGNGPPVLTGPKTPVLNGPKTPVLAAPAAPIPPALAKTKTIPTQVANNLRRRIKAAGGCNANVCFAVDGSGRIPPKAFKNQLNFLLDVVSVIAVDNPIELAAIQYASRRHRITPLTIAVESFVLAVDKTKQAGGLSKTRAGLQFCANQLSRRPGEANKIVLLSDGYTTAGGKPFPIARRFLRRSCGDISVVKVGPIINQNALLKLVDWNAERVFDVKNFFDVLRIQSVVEKLVADICEVEGKSGFPKPKRQRRRCGRGLKNNRRNQRRRRGRWARRCRRNPSRCNWVR